MKIIKLIKILLLFCIVKANAQNRNDSKYVYHGFYISNQNEKVSADFIVKNRVDIQHKIGIVLNNGEVKYYKPGAIKSFQLNQEDTINKPAIYEIINIGSRQLFLLRKSESGVINEYFYYYRFKGSSDILIGTIIANDRKKGLYLISDKFVFGSKRAMIDFVSEDSLIVKLIKSRDLQGKGDMDLIIDEYKKWKEKQLCLNNGDSLSCVISNKYLGVHNDTSYVLKGIIDADKNYKPRYVFLSTLLSTGFLTPIVGVPYTVVVGSRPIKESNLRIPDPILKLNEDYNRAYKRRAKQIKIDRAVKGSLLGFLVFTGFVGLLTGFK